MTCPLQVTCEDSSKSLPSADILEWESKAHKIYLERKVKFNYVRIASVSFDLCTIILQRFEAVHSVKQDNLIPPPFSPSTQEKLIYGAAGMLITKLSTEFGSEVLGS